MIPVPGLWAQLGYGDRELFVLATAHPAAWDRPDSGYGLWEWADLFNLAGEGLRDTQFCGDPDRVHSVVALHLDWLSRHSTVLAMANAGTREHLDEARNQRQVAWQAAEDGRVRAAAVTRARKNFRQKEWMKVVTELSAHEGQLTPSELKLLGISRRRGEEGAE